MYILKHSKQEKKQNISCFFWDTLAHTCIQLSVITWLKLNKLFDLVLGLLSKTSKSLLVLTPFSCLFFQKLFCKSCFTVSLNIVPPSQKTQSSQFIPKIVYQYIFHVKTIIDEIQNSTVFSDALFPSLLIFISICSIYFSLKHFKILH